MNDFCLKSKKHLRVSDTRKMSSNKAFDYICTVYALKSLIY